MSKTHIARLIRTLLSNCSVFTCGTLFVVFPALLVHDLAYAGGAATIGTPPQVYNDWQLTVDDPSNLFGQGARFTFAPGNAELAVQEASAKKINLAFYRGYSVWEMTAEVLGTASQRRIQQGHYYGNETAIASNSTTQLSAPSTTAGVRVGLWNMGQPIISGCTLTPRHVDIRAWEVGPTIDYVSNQETLGKIVVSVKSACTESPYREVAYIFTNKAPSERETLLDISTFQIRSVTENPSYPVSNLLIGRPWMSGSITPYRLPSSETIDIRFQAGQQPLMKRISRVHLQAPNGTYVPNYLDVSTRDGYPATGGATWQPAQPPGMGRSAAILVNLESDYLSYGNRLLVNLAFQPLSKVFALNYIKIYTKPPFYSWQNQRNACDVNDDGFVSAIDLLILNAEPAHSGKLPITHWFKDPLIDVNGDGYFSPIDLLTVQSCLR